MPMLALAQRPQGNWQGGAGAPEPRFIRGTVASADGQPLPYASVVARSIRDSTLFIGSATDIDGKFELIVRPGRFKVTASFLSFKDLILNEVATLQGDVDLGVLKLQPNTELVDEVTITAERSQMELQLDKRVFNVDKDITSRGSNAQDLLNNVPSVSVDMDGNVSLRGSQNVRILIDGKPSSLTGMSGSDALRRMPSAMIEKVEVVTNASAKYDAEGEAGIINIVLKKEKALGLNGAFDVSAGWPNNYSASANMNYRQGKWNTFTGISVSFRENPGQGKSYQQFHTPDTTFSYIRLRQHLRSNFGGNIRLGTDYSPDAKTNITISGMYGRSIGANSSNLSYFDINALNELTATTLRSETEHELGQNAEADLNLRRSFKVPEQLLTASVRITYGYEPRSSTIAEGLVGQQAELGQRVMNNQTDRNIVAQTDYTHPFGKFDSRIETGIKATLRHLSTNYKVGQLTDGGYFAVLPEFDNSFAYDENVYAAYLLGKAKFGKFAAQVGVRGELSDVTTLLIKSDSTNNRLYFNVFPSAHLAYELNRGNTIQFSYSYRISRPNHRELMPFFSLSDNRNFRQGNPFLNPEFTHSIEAGHLKSWNKGTLLTNVYFRHRNGVRQNISQGDSTGFIRSFPVNLSTQNAVGLELNFNYELFKWWRLNFNINTYYSRTEGSYLGESLFAEAFSANGRVSTRFTIAKRIEAQTSFGYNAPEQGPQGLTRSMYGWDAGLSTDVLKGNGTITFNVRDILNSRRRRWDTETPTFTSSSEFQWRLRQFTVSFTYRLNQKKQRRQGREGGGTDGGGMDEGF